MYYKFNLNLINNYISTNTDFWHYISYEQVADNIDIDDVLEDEDQIDEVIRAIKILNRLENDLIEMGIIKYNNKI